MLPHQLQGWLVGQAATKGSPKMVGSNKILTVSYGTFSCTLEGFDEPFMTMKAIAEYFRDLAAEDRYFGAEPPTPDAEMLQRIAEREIQRRVEARVSEHGLTLRQAEPAPAAEAQPAAPLVLPVAATVAAVAVADEPAQAHATPEPAADEPQTEPAEVEVALAPVEAEVEPEVEPEPEVEAEAEVEEVQAAADLQDDGEDDDLSLDVIMAEAAQDLPEAEPAQPATILFAEPDVAGEEDSVAAKLARIRAVVEGVRNGTASQVMDEEDAVTDPVAAPVDADFAFDIDTHEDMPELVAAEAARAAQHDEPDMEQSEAEPVIAEASADDMDEDDDAPVAAEADMIAAAEPVFDPAYADDDEDFDGEDADIDYALEAEEAEEAAAVAESQPDPAPTEPEDAELLARLSDLGLTAQTSEPAVATEAEADAMAMPQDDDLDAAIAAMAPEMEPDAQGDDQAEEQPGFFQRARARVIRLSKVATILGHSNADEAKGDAPAPEAIDEPQPAAMEVAAADRYDDAGDEDPDVSRLMDEAKSKLEGAESRRRFSAISHLKAAVAATLADRQMQPGEMQQTPQDEARNDLEPYRDDLSKAVRPRRPSAEAASATPRPSLDKRPAPLVLVSEQRVDRPHGAAHDGAAIRPRRISAGNLAVFSDPEDEDEGAEVTPESATSFADFAGKIGATSLIDLLEAAAVYTASVEGRATFSRPQILRKVEFVSTRSYNREDSLRSFGTLLRQGKIQKTGRGQFTVTGNSRFMAEARRVH